jgi:hypothetical protein
MPVAALSASPRPGATYSGTTSQGQRMSLRVMLDGLRVFNFKIRRQLSCVVGGETETVAGTFQQVGRPVRVSRRGVFKATVEVTGEEGGQIESGRASFRARFSADGRRLRGAYRERLVLRNGGSCSTGRVTFRARARR